MANLLYVGYDPTGLFKIGITDNEERRLKQIRTGNPFFSYIFFVQCENAAIQELEFHTVFARKRVKGEWFSLNPSDLKFMYDKLLDGNYDVKIFESFVNSLKRWSSSIFNGDYSNE